jgi:hypothetical protein
MTGVGAAAGVAAAGTAAEGGAAGGGGDSGGGDVPRAWAAAALAKKKTDASVIRTSFTEFLRAIGRCGLGFRGRSISHRAGATGAYEGTWRRTKRAARALDQVWA